MSEPVLLWSCDVPREGLPRHKTKTNGMQHGLPTKNDYTRVAHRRVVTKPSWRTTLAKAYEHGEWSFDAWPPLDQPMRFVLTIYAPRKHASGPMKGRGKVDSDACLWCARDALETPPRKGEPPVLVDDDRIVGDTTHVVYRKGNPGLRLELWSAP